MPFQACPLKEAPCSKPARPETIPASAWRTSSALRAEAGKHARRVEEHRVNTAPALPPPAADTEPLRRAVRFWLTAFVVGLFLSGATAIPLLPELDMLLRVLHSNHASPPALVRWIETVQAALRTTDARYPFLAYGTDWLAFGHFAIAIAFLGPLRDPVRNVWVITFGMIACVLVVPYALVFGALRGIPFWWRLIDCSFGVVGILPLWHCRRLIGRLAQLTGTAV